MARLTWSGNLQAQRDADKAFAKLKPKRKRKTKKQRRIARAHKAARRRARAKGTLKEKRQWVDYAKYMQSPHWKATRSAALLRAGNMCEVCLSTRQLEVHHKNYERLYRELPTDLAVLCKSCHDDAHFGDPFGYRDWDSLDIASSA